MTGSFQVFEISTVSGGVSPTFGDALRQSHLAFRVDILPVDTASLSEPIVARVRQLPAPREGRYSFRDMMSLLDAKGRTAFEAHGREQDAVLRAQHENGEISSLYFYRCLARMTQEQVAKRAHSRQAFVSQLEKRRRPLTWKQAKKLGSALGVSPEKLMEHA